MRFLSWLRGESRREYYYRKYLEEVEDQIGDSTIGKKVDGWINEFRDEETLGFAILQRQRRLENEKQTAEEQQQQQQKQQFRRRRCKRCQYQKEMCSACHGTTQSADDPPPYLDRSPKDLELDLAKLREEFSKNRTRLEAIKEKLRDSESWWALLAMVPRWHTDAGRTFAWVEARGKCADTGAMAEAHAHATLSFWQKLDPSHLIWLFLAFFVIAICYNFLGEARLYLELLVKLHHIKELRAMPPSRERDVELGQYEEEVVRMGWGRRRW
ncbi:hypothetical protein AbraIFM66950_010718 [Aspergillus brasiliensis]|nr:hypothetical protein AbraIFM66950_010718 [Aspergillus brasiliensis]